VVARAVAAPLSCGLALAALGCGGEPRDVEPPRPRVVLLNWHEAAGKPGERMIVRIASVAVRERGWSVRASLENDTAATLFIGRPHTTERATFGLVPAASTRKRGSVPTGLLATRYSPPLPRILDPGERWTGTFSGGGVVRRGTRVRIAFGTFWAYGGVRVTGRRRMLFRVFTDHVVTL
jgi:hypothetical protein